MKNKYRGFTIVELVIVIAVVAVLAAVVIPTFATIIKKTNVSADTQAARNMNVILASESASDVPMNIRKVKELLENNGVGDFSTQTRFYNFFWLEHENVIVLADEGDRPVYPEEYLDATRTDGWRLLDATYSIELPPKGDPKDEDRPDDRIFTVTVTQSGLSEIIPFDIPTTAKEGHEFNLDIVLPEAFRTESKRYTIQKVTAIMHDGDKEYKIEVFPKKVFEWEPLTPSKFTAHAEISIPNVTGNIEINIDVVEYCFITINIPADGGTSLPLIVRKGGSSGLKLSSAIKSGFEIISAKAYRNGEPLGGELYDEKYDIIRIGKEFTTEDFEIRVELAPVDQTPEPTE